MQAVRPDPATTPTPAGSVSPDEIARFGTLASRWWDPNGPMRPLHRMNSLRVRWIERQIARSAASSRDGRLRLLDLGCGAGLASEALAAIGHDVLGVDASAPAIDAARAHQALTQGEAGRSSGTLSYRCDTAEALVGEGQKFDVVLALELIEHVPDPADFVMLLERLLVPGGLLIVSTLNRTWRSLAGAKIGAEYVLRLLPVGTHDWHKFVTPAELGRYGGKAGLRLAEISGMVPTTGGWRESRDTGVNYIALLESR